MKFRLIFGFFVAIFSVNVASIDVRAQPLRLVSLNLHGYHPMLEAPRYQQDLSMELKPADPDVFFYTLDELARGSAKQLDTLAARLKVLKPDFVFLQEVGAGLPNSPKNCAEFIDDTRPDALGKNTALRLNSRLKLLGLTYQPNLACRGNIGWQTNPDVLQNKRILRKTADGFETVFEMNTQPYPNGLIVEGTSVLVSSAYKILHSANWHVSFGTTNETFFFQTVIVQSNADSKWFLLVNLHGGREVQHFEEAVAIRKKIAELISRQVDAGSFGGVIVGGDFNANLYRPFENSGDAASVPWEERVPNEFNYSHSASDAAFGTLTKKMKGSESEKEFAVSTYRDFLTSPASALKLREAIELGEKSGQCSLKGLDLKAFAPACSFDDRIDLAFISAPLKVTNAAMLWTEDRFDSATGLSDHPGFIVDLTSN